MFLFNPSQIVRNCSIRVPYAVRAAMGWHNGTTLDVSAADVTPANVLMNELILSPLPLAARADLWHLTALFYDRPRLIGELLTLLTAQYIDIVSIPATTRDHATQLAVKIDIDTRLYQSQFDGDSSARSSNLARRLEELEARLLARFAEDLLFREDGRSPVRIDRHRQLRQSSLSMVRRGTSTLQDGGLTLSSALLDDIRDQVAVRWPHILSSGAHPRAFLTAEPVVSILRVVLHWPDTGHLHVRVETPNDVGTISSIATSLGASRFNILQMYTRRLAAKDRTLSDLLVALPADADRNFDDRALRRFARAALLGANTKVAGAIVTFPPALGAFASRVGARKGKSK